MRQKNLPWLALLGAVLVAVVAGSGPSVAVPSPQDPAQTLEERVAALEELAQVQAERIAELEALFVQLGDGLAAGTQRLDLALAASRLNGFEWNQNPRSHTDVLEGLRGFSSLVRSGLGAGPVNIVIEEIRESQGIESTLYLVEGEEVGPDVDSTVFLVRDKEQE